MKRRLDTLLNKFISRKLMVFIIASLGLFASALTSSDWVTIAAVYIDGQSCVDVIAKLKQQ